MLLCSLKPNEIPCHLKKLTLTTSIFEGHKGFWQDDPGDFFSEGATAQGRNFTIGFLNYHAGKSCLQELGLTTTR